MSSFPFFARVVEMFVTTSNEDVVKGIEHMREASDELLSEHVLVSNEANDPNRTLIARDPFSADPTLTRKGRKLGAATPQRVVGPRSQQVQR